MKILNIIFVTVLVSLSLTEIPVCEAQYLEILKYAGKAIKIALKAREQLKPFLEKQNKTADEIIKNGQKLDTLLTRFESSDRLMMSELKRLMKELEKNPGETVTQYTASKFERYMQTINQTLGQLVSKKEKVNRGELTLDDHFRHDVDNYKEDLEKYKNKLEVILQSKSLSVDFLAQVKNKANVCTDRMTQVQLLDSFRALYVDTISRYLIAKHIVISLWESIDKTKHDDKKRELNSDVRRDLQTYASRFQELMSNASREFQLCDKPSSEYTIQNTGNKPRKCYFVGEGSLSNEIASLTGHSAGNSNCWDYVSLRPTTARPGYAVVGAKIEHNANILYIKLIEAKLLPNGLIDPESVTYNEASEPGIGEKVALLHYRHGVIDLTETILPDDRVITGLKFSESTDDKHVYLDVQSTRFDLDKGVLIDGTTRSEPHEKAINQHKLRHSGQRNDTTVRNNIGLQSITPKEYLKFVPGAQIHFHPYIDLSDTYPTPLTLLSGASLYVRYVEGYQGLLSIRLHTLNVAPHVTKIDFELNEDFADVLTSI